MSPDPHLPLATFSLSDCSSQASPSLSLLRLHGSMLHLGCLRPLIALLRCSGSISTPLWASRSSTRGWTQLQKLPLHLRERPDLAPGARLRCRLCSLIFIVLVCLISISGVLFSADTFVHLFSGLLIGLLWIQSSFLCSLTPLLSLFSLPLDLSPIRHQGREGERGALVSSAMGATPQLLRYGIKPFRCLSAEQARRTGMRGARRLCPSLLWTPLDAIPWRQEASPELCNGWYGVKECTPDGRVTKLVLEFLNLNGTLTSEILSPLDQLRVLGFKSNSLSGAIPDLAPLINLKSLYLNNNRFFGRILATLAVLHCHKVVDLCSNLLYGPIPVGFARMPRLYTLFLQNNSLTRKIPAFA